ncbi:hypothetical protein ACH5RR_008905 [Cinchona calisaya]|uniref:Uncharacterized protein n=1 Tax=Cinchona calisaya TaxID=153742 RepID=A0ABD3AEK5_9GENT
MFTPQAYDRILSVEIPDKEANPYLYSLVVQHMIHGPCGKINPNFSSMKEMIDYKSHYPKDFMESTKHSAKFDPVYDQRKNNRTVNIKGYEVENRWLVPYNPYLLSMLKYVPQYKLLSICINISTKVMIR